MEQFETDMTNARRQNERLAQEREAAGRKFIEGLETTHRVLASLREQLTRALPKAKRQAQKEL